MYVVLKRFQLNDKDFDFYDRPLFFDSYSDALIFCKNYIRVLEYDPSNDDLIIAKVCYKFFSESCDHRKF